MRYTPYRTNAGDRLDHIALAHYGDQMLVADIYQANAAVLGSPRVPVVLPAGLQLRIPVREEPAIRSTVGLPPWKR